MTDELRAATSPVTASADTPPPSLPSPSSQVTIPLDLWRSVLIAQLSECWNDVRNIDSLVWQIPAGIGAILGLVLSGLGTQVVKGRPNVLDVAAMFAVVLISYSLIIALYKNRKLQQARSIYLKSIYKQLLLSASATSDDAAVSPTLKLNDYNMDELPGFVAHSTHDVVQAACDASPELASRVASFKTSYFKRSAYRTMFYMSVLVLVGELFLAIWLLIRLI